MHILHSLFTNEHIILYYFFTMLILFHIIFLFMLKPSKTISRSIEYTWLLIAALGLIKIISDVRPYVMNDASNNISFYINRTKQTYDSTLARFVDRYCTNYVDGIYSTNLQEQNKYVDTACKHYQEEISTHDADSQAELYEYNELLDATPNDSEQYGIIRKLNMTARLHNSFAKENNQYKILKDKTSAETIYIYIYFTILISTGLGAQNHKSHH